MAFDVLKNLKKVQRVWRGQSKEDDLRSLLQEKILCALAHGEPAKPLSIIAIMINREKHASQAREELDRIDCPLNVSIFETCGRCNVDFILCGYLPAGWESALELDSRKALFPSWFRFDVERHRLYKGRDFPLPRPATEPAIVQSLPELEQFWKQTDGRGLRKGRIYICNPSLLPIRTFVGFIDFDGDPLNWWDNVKQYKAKVIEPIRDFYTVPSATRTYRIAPREIPGIPLSFKKIDIIVVAQFEELAEINGSWHYTSAMMEMNKWRDTINGTDELQSKVQIVETWSIRPSHEQYSLEVDVLDRLKQFVFQDQAR